MSIKDFNEHILSGTVKRQRPNRQRTAAIMEEAAGKKDFLEISIKSVPPGKMSPNFIVDQCYDIMMELIRAKMFLEGYNAGNSHEAEVSYLTELGFPKADVRFMDELRYFRNGTKYYGTVLDKEYSDKVLEFFKRMHPRLLEKIERV